MRLFAALSLLCVSASFTPTTVAKAADPARVIGIVATDDMKYSVTTINAKPGETITIRLMSKGLIPKIAMAHNVVVLKLGTDVLKLLKDGAPHRDTDFIPPAMKAAVIAKTPFAGAGETVQITFKVPAKPGTYPYICTFAGHYQAGMKGTLVVK
ncbi:MAG: plastocyanin/azurin family copper-binding protein [Vicinamibacterales bacterium]